MGVFDLWIFMRPLMLGGVGFGFLYFHLLSFCMTCEQLLMEFLIYFLWYVLVRSTMGTGSFLGVKRPGRGADHPPPSKCRGQERVGLYLYSPSGPSWPVMEAPLLVRSFQFW